MPGASCLYRRPSGIYVVRLAVPIRLRSEIGRTEVHVSTGLREPGAAKIAALKIQAEWRERFMTVDIAKLTNSSPLLHGGGLIALPGAADAIGLSLRDLLPELLNERAPLITQATGWHGWRVINILAIERGPDGVHLAQDIRMHGEEIVFAGLVRAWNSRATVAGLMAGQKSTERLFHVAAEAAFFCESEIDVPIEAWLVQKAVVERIRQRLSGGVLPLPTTPALPQAETSPPAWPSAEDLNVLGPYRNKRFSELFAMYEKNRKWAADQTRRMNTEAGLFVELMNDPVMSSIDLELIHEFARRLAELPTNIYLTRRRYGAELSLQDLAAIAKDKALELKNQATVARHVSKIAEILNFGVQPAGWLRINPAAGFQRSRNFGAVRRAQDYRDAFNAKELDSIFSVSWFKSGGKGENDHWRPHFFWMPLLALATGGRLNELAQLYLDDVRLSDSGTWYIDFNLEGSDKLDIDESDETDKSLKTANAIRVVPLHGVVIDAGLPGYVQALRQAGYERLFPELRRDPVKGYGKPVGSWFNERFLGQRLKIERNGRKVFHSFRHNFVTTLERLDAPERVMAQLAGHERGSTQSGTRYGKDRDADAMKSLIDRLEFPSLKNLDKFDPAAGLRAVKIALSRKVKKP